MFNHPQAFLFGCLLTFTFCCQSPSHAQKLPSDFTLKESVVSILFQYGKEVFHRGLDPQEASYVFQRIVVLDCKHAGAREFLMKIKETYPQVSIRILDCPEIPSDQNEKPTIKTILEEMNETSAVNVNDQEFDPLLEMSSVANDQNAASTDLDDQMPVSGDFHAESGYEAKIQNESDGLRASQQSLRQELSLLEKELQEKDAVILDFQKQLGDTNGNEDVSYSGIAQHQQDLIRIQQSNIEYLKSELAEAKKERTVGVLPDGDLEYMAMQQEIADSHLTAQEKQMDVESKDDEVRTLEEELAALKEQLRLVQEIVNQKNAMIRSLQEELKAESGLR